MKVKFSVPVILEYMVSINIHPKTVNKKLHVCVPNLYLDLPSIYCIYVCFLHSVFRLLFMPSTCIKHIWNKYSCICYIVLTRIIFNTTFDCIVYTCI